MTALEYFMGLTGGATPQLLAQNVTMTPNEIDLAFTEVYDYFLNTNSPFWKLKKNVKQGVWRTTHLSSSGIAVQPGNDSCSFNPIGSMYTSTNDIPICKFAIQDQICYDEFLEGCLEWLGGYELNAGNPNATPAGKILMNAYLALKMMDIKQNILDVVWFGYKGYSGTAFDDAAPENVPASELAKWKMYVRNLLTQCDGILYAIQSGVLDNGKKMVVETTGGDPYLTAWDGLDLSDDGSGNAILGSEIFTILKDSDPSSPLFRTSQNHGFLVSYAIYKSYYDELIGAGFGIPQQYFLQTGSTATPAFGMPLMWRGIPVYHCPDLDYLPNKFFGKVNAHSAIYTVWNNLCVGTDIQSNEGGTLAPELRIARGTDLPTQDIVYYKGKFRLGAGIASPKMVKAMFSYDLASL